MARDERTFFTYPTAFGPVTIGADGQAVTAVVLGEAALPGTGRATAITTEAANQVMEYLAGKRTAFTVACAPAGTDFQLRVWQAVANIPYGQTRTTREIAATIGAADAYRAVGAAVRKSPLAVLIPAHRIVSATGKAAGPVESALLNLEQQNSR